jgi:DNA ligase-1
MLLAEIVDTSRAVAETPARTKKTELIASLLGRAAHEELDVAVAFLSGELRQGKIGLGYGSVRDAAGVAAAGAPGLTLLAVDEVFQRVAETNGTGSARERARLLAELFSRATGGEQQFLARLVVGELRQGALEGVLVEAVARRAKVSSRSIRRALMLSGDLRRVARVATTRGEEGLSEFRIVLFRPLLPMLAQTAESLEAAFAGAGELALEHKLDGARIQVHKDGRDVRIYTRNLNDVTERVPEIVSAVERLDAPELVLDGEAIALRADGRPHPFQTTMRRFGRQLDVDSLRAELPIRAFFFDLLHVRGDDLVDLGERERFRMLTELLPPELAITHTVAGSAGEARAFLGAALALGHEGILVKSLEAPYEAGRRGAEWLKVKPSHTLDLVVLAVEWGSGRRRGLLSNLHLGARDPATGGFVMLGKTFKGMTDEMLKWQTERLLALEVSRSAHTVYVKPELVVEVAFDGVQESSQYPGGLALRFARVKAYREDKSPSEADTIDTVRRIHERSR